MSEIIGRVYPARDSLPLVAHTCQDCRWWVNPPPYTPWQDVPPEYGQCIGPHVRYLRDPPTDGVSYGDYEGDGAWYYTGPEYGCIHWTPKEK